MTQDAFFKWNEPNSCECGAPLPPMKEWHYAGRDWSHTICSSCGRFFVDEEDFIASYGRDELDDDQRCAECAA